MNDDCNGIRKRRRYAKAKQTNIRRFAENVLNKRVATDVETLTIYANKLKKNYQEFEELQLLSAVKEDELLAEDQ